jgi:hypothetical protein
MFLILSFLKSYFEENEEYICKFIEEKFSHIKFYCIKKSNELPNQISIRFYDDNTYLFLQTLDHFLSLNAIYSFVVFIDEKYYFNMKKMGELDNYDSIPDKNIKNAKTFIIIDVDNYTEYRKLLYATKYYEKKFGGSYKKIMFLCLSFSSHFFDENKSTVENYLKESLGEGKFEEKRYEEMPNEVLIEFHSEPEQFLEILNHFFFNNTIDAIGSLVIPIHFHYYLQMQEWGYLDKVIKNSYRSFFKPENMGNVYVVLDLSQYKDFEKLLTLVSYYQNSMCDSGVIDDETDEDEEDENNDDENDDEDTKVSSLNKED